MPKIAAHSIELGRAASSPRMMDVYAIVPMLACVYAVIAFPLILVSCNPDDSACLYEARPESRIFWPLLAAISVGMVMRNWSRLTFPPVIMCLLACLAFAGASVLWAYSPEISFVRYVQQVMIVTSIVLPAMLAARNVDLMRALFLCFAVAAILNVFFVIGRPPIDYKFVTWGYPGYFSGKNYLGEFATIAFLLSLYEAIHPGRRRVFGIVIAVVAVSLLILANSKTSMGLAILAPVLAGATLIARRMTRLSPAIILLSIPIGYLVMSTITGITVNRISFMLYGDSTFTGRTVIWDFANLEIAQRPLLGWGYQSFWLVGPNAPSVLEAPGWVKTMPNAHNGYLDTMLEMGYVGYALLLTFIVATLHAIGRMADRDLARAWLVLSLAVHIIITNGLESLWMRGFEMLWVVFLFLAAEAGRHWRLQPGRSLRVRRPRVGPRRFGPSHGASKPVSPATA